MLDGDERAIGAALHLRYVGGDPTARDEIFGRYLPDMTDDLRRRIRRGGLFLRHDDIEILADNAALDALASYVKRPEQYRLDGGRTLGGYLRMSALGDFKNALKAAIQRGRHIVTLRAADVGFDDDDRNGPADVLDRLADPDDPFEEVVDADATATLRARYADVPRTEEERVVFDLILDGERSNEVAARALGWSGRLTKDRTAQIDRIKERLTKRMRRRDADGLDRT